MRFRDSLLKTSLRDSNFFKISARDVPCVVSDAFRVVPNGVPSGKGKGNYRSETNYLRD